MNSTPLLRSLGAAAAGALGQRLASQLVERFARALERTPEARSRAVSPLAAQSYVNGSTFAPFNANQVEAWAADQLGRMDTGRAHLILSAAGAGSDGSVDSVMRGIVAHLAGMR